MSVTDIDVKDAHGDIKNVSIPAARATTNALADAALGVPSGAKVITDANGTIQQYLRGLVFNWAAALGAGTSTASLRTTLASDDPAVAALGATSGAKVITDASGTIQQYLRGLVSQWIAGTLVVGAGQNVIGKVDGDTVLITADGTFTLPSSTQYAVGELVANSATANLVVASAFTITKTSGQITSAGLKKSSVSVTSAVFRAHIYAADPTLSTGVVNGDNAAFSTKVGSYLGAIDLNMDQAFSDAAFGRGTPRVGNVIEFSGVSGLKLYALYEARATYTPTSGETITPTLGVAY